MHELWQHLLPVYVKLLDKLQQDWPGTSCDIYQVCPHCVNAGIDPPHTYRKEILHKEVKVDRIPCKNADGDGMIDASLVCPPRELQLRYGLVHDKQGFKPWSGIFPSVTLQPPDVSTAELELLPPAIAEDITDVSGSAESKEAATCDMLYQNVSRNVQRGQQKQFLKSRDTAVFKAFHESFVQCSKSVGYLLWKNGMQGTVFRIGHAYVMTCYHVVKPQEFGHNETPYVTFNYDRQLTPASMERPKLHYISDQNPVVWHSEALDVAVLKLKEPFPDTLDVPVLTNFALNVTPSTKGDFHFIGHPSDLPKVIDNCCEIQPTDTEKFKLWIEEMVETCGVSNYDGLDADNRILYHTSKRFSEGASGSPGFVPGPNQEARLAVMHAAGYPKFYYDMTEAEKSCAPVAKFTLEQGILIRPILDEMKQTSPELYRDIFEREANVGVSMP